MMPPSALELFWIGVRDVAPPVSAQAPAAAFGDVAVEKFGRAVQLRRELQRWQREKDLGLRLRRRQVVAGEGVDVRAVGHAAGSQSRRFFGDIV